MIGSILLATSVWPSPWAAENKPARSAQDENLVPLDLRRGASLHVGLSALPQLACARVYQA
jgi:hypothetical protein